MPFRRVTWRTWAVTAAVVAAYVGCGFAFSSNGVVEEWLYRVGLIGASALPVAFIAIYTWLGLTTEQPGAKWWRNPFGSALVLAAASLIPIAWPLCWVFWVNNGMLTSTWLAWFEVSGPVLAALAWARVCVIWLRVNAAERAAVRANPSAD